MTPDQRAAQGLGTAIARVFARQGARLVLVDVAAEAGLDPNFTVQENRQELVEERQQLQEQGRKFASETDTARINRIALRISP